MRTWTLGAALLGVVLSTAWWAQTPPSRVEADPNANADLFPSASRANPTPVRVVTSDPAILGDRVVAPYRLVRLKADGVGPKTGLLWDVQPADKADLVEGLDRCCLQFVAPPGRYAIELLTVTVRPDGVPDLRRVRDTVTISGTPPGPDPGPGPGPGPTPPDPTPPDSLTRALQAAYDRDPPDCAGVSKAQCKAKLIRVYVAARNTDLSVYRTAGDLFTALKEMARKAELPEAALPQTRDAIARELREILPASPTATLTQDHKANAATLFGRLVKSLEAVQ